MKDVRRREDLGVTIMRSGTASMILYIKNGKEINTISWIGRVTMFLNLPMNPVKPWYKRTRSSGQTSKIKFEGFLL